MTFGIYKIINKYMYRIINLNDSLPKLRSRTSVRKRAISYPCKWSPISCRRDLRTCCKSHRDACRWRSPPRTYSRPTRWRDDRSRRWRARSPLPDAIQCKRRVVYALATPPATRSSSSTIHHRVCAIILSRYKDSSSRDAFLPLD